MAGKKKGLVIGQAAQLEKLVKQAFIAVGLGIALLII